ncbi:MAG: DUF3592 domain-containing protein [Anaerolineales bacterium]|nr:DUF3592 domain-containing protein [Anaerolineales bacterium]
MDGNLYCLGIFGLIFFLAALMAASRAVKDWQKYRASQHWLNANGQILNTYISTQGSANKGKSHQVHISYSYEVMGQGYQGNQLSFGSEGNSYDTRSSAEKEIARFPEGSPVTVYYDPDRPAEAVLERKYNSTGAILAVILGVLGAGIMVYAYFQLSSLGYLG